MSAVCRDPTPIAPETPFLHLVWRSKQGFHARCVERVSYWTAVWVVSRDDSESNAMETATSFASGCRRRLAAGWLLVYAGVATCSDPTRPLKDRSEPRETGFEIVATDVASQRIAIRFEGDRKPGVLAVGGSAVRDLRLISVRAELALIEYFEPDSKSPVLLQVRQGVAARLRAVPKLPTEAATVVKISDIERSDRAEPGATPSSKLRAGRQSSDAE